MAKRSGIIREKIAEIFEIPRDIIMDLPNMTLIGNAQLFIENHRGIIEYEPNKIRLNTARGEIIIEGDALMIETITDEEIILSGRFRKLEYADWGGW